MSASHFRSSNGLDLFVVFSNSVKLLKKKKSKMTENIIDNKTTFILDRVCQHLIKKVIIFKEDYI